MKRKLFFISCICILLFAFTIPTQASVLNYELKSETTSLSGTLKLNKTKVSMYITDTYMLKAATNLKNLKWTSNNTKVATVKNGKVVAKNVGTAQISVSANGLKKTCQITVKGDWYKKVLNSYTGTYKMRDLWSEKYVTVFRRDFNRYCVIDINHDGVKELMLYNHPKVAFFTYCNGKVTPLIYNSFSRGVYLVSAD